jgi:hypothetical protein
MGMWSSNQAGKRLRVERPGSRGFSVVEVLLSVTVLTFGLLANMPLIALAQKQNEVNRYRMFATNVAQRELVQFVTHAIPSGGSFQDKDGNWIQASCLPGINSCGNSLTGSGDIDFSLAATPGFSLSQQDLLGVNYDIRWNIHAAPSNKTMIVVGVGAKKGIVIVPPVDLKAFVAP